MGNGPPWEPALPAISLARPAPTARPVPTAGKSIFILTLFALLPSLLHAQAQVRAEPVILAPIVEQLPVSGSIVSPRSSKLTTQSSGLVLSINVDAGDRVEQGEVLLELDSELTRLELERLLARQEEASLQFQDARRLAEEGRRLIDDRNIPRSQYESRLATEASEESRLRQLATEVQMQRVKLARHTLRAPFSGVIGSKNTEVGQWLNAGNPALLLVQLDPLRVQARIPERYFDDVRPGTAVTISVDAHPGKVIRAEVQSVVPVTDSNTRSFTTRMDIPNADHLLAPGMSAHLVFGLGDQASRPVLQVPPDAIVRHSDGRAEVWVVRDGVANPVPVTVGRRSRQHVEVSASELAEGDLAVTLGNESLRPGAAVTVARD
jgi:multidrug efflux system membrane fusion protein